MPNDKTQFFRDFLSLIASILAHYIKKTRIGRESHAMLVGKGGANWEKILYLTEFEWFIWPLIRPQ